MNVIQKAALVALGVGLLVSLSNCESSAPAGCIKVADKVAHLRAPGTYCLTRRLDTQLDLPHRGAEIALVVVESSDVVLDLQGHGIGDLTPLFRTGRSGGILINANVRNFVVRNGTIRNLGVCIRRDFESDGTGLEVLQPLRPTPDTFFVPGLNISGESVHFKHCGEDFKFLKGKVEEF